MGHIVKNNFIWNFDIGRNISYNLKILQLLYEYYANEKDGRKELLHKPIIIMLISIVEAIFFDFFKRIQEHTNEKILNLSGKEIEYIWNKEEASRLREYIDIFQKKKIIGSDKKYYKILNELKELRNRIHIQNERSQTPKNEMHTFKEKDKKSAQKVLEYTLKFLSFNYPRPDEEKIQRHLHDFVLPWEAHWKDEKMFAKKQ